MEFLSDPHRKTKLTVIILSYVVFAAIFGYTYRYTINPDGISILRLAGYIVDGNFQRSVTPTWSPLLSWLSSLFIFMGFDGLTAARIVIAFGGAGLLYSSWLLSGRLKLPENLRFIATLTAALLISYWTIQFIAADVIVAALVVSYVYLLVDPHIFKNKKIPFLCGIISGCSYLAHHYAFPFFMAHFPAMLLLTGYFARDGRGMPWKKILTAWAVGIAGFVIIASIWVGIVSVKYGKLTISAKGGIAHAVMGPKDVDRRHPFFVGGLFIPKDSYAMHVFEDPSDVEFKTWSPFESREYFIHQLKVIKANFIYIINHFVRVSPFFTYASVLVIISLIPIALFLNKLDIEKKFIYSWVVITFSIYCSGFLLLIARSPRRFYAMMIIFLFVSFHFLSELKIGIQKHISKEKAKLLSYYLLLILISAFALKPGVELLKSVKTSVTQGPVNPYQEIAEQINSVQFPSPYAIIRSSQKPHTDTYLAYYLKKQLLGRPLSRDAKGILKELEAVNAKALLVFDNPQIVEELKKDKKFIHVASKALKQDSRYMNAVNIVQDEITGWDKEVNIFTLK